MKVKAYINSLKDHANNRHVQDEVKIVKKIDGIFYLAEYNGVQCMAIFNPFLNSYFVDDVYGIIQDTGSQSN